MQFCTLGSGSRGNAHLIEHRGTTLLLDCGFALSGLRRRLAQRAVAPAEIDAVLISHEHTDHVCGLRRLLAETGLPVYMTRGTAAAMHRPQEWRRIEEGGVFSIGELQVLPFGASHDAAEPVQFVFDDGERRLAVITDVGEVPPRLSGGILQNLSAIIVECNYDKAMLAANRNYPPAVKERIAGALGHLDNSAAARLIAEVNHRGLRHVVAAHLSEQNNSPECVRRALHKACGGKLTIAGQREGTGWLVL
ncbi:MAG: MBL fold metallo-hydrolase [Gammaproteobacteria bacterium]